MKTFLLLLLAGGATCLTTAADAQMIHIPKTVPRRVYGMSQPGDSMYYFNTRSFRYTSSEKSLNTSTMGVMGEDTIKVNAKGRRTNLNYNTGTPLPPSTGNATF